MVTCTNVRIDCGIVLRRSGGDTPIDSVERLRDTRPATYPAGHPGYVQAYRGKDRDTTFADLSLGSTVLVVPQMP